MKRIALLTALGSVSLLLAGCASERFVLLPSVDGRPAAVVLKTGDSTQELNTPYAAAATRGNSLSAYRTTPEYVAEHFGPALAALPARPERFTLYFLEGKDELTEESRATLDSLKAAVKARPAAELMVVGHTDRVGSAQLNDELSLKRAEFVRATLVADGLPEQAIEAAGRGEREPLVPTEDEVAEARNRRVEVTIR